MILQCPFCATQVRPGVQDCPRCARRMLRDCPYCAETIAANAPLCKYCGERMEETKRQPLRVAAPKAEVEFLEEPVTISCSWEDTKKGVLRRWWGTALAANFSPGRFFRALPKASGHKWPVGFSFALVAQGLIVGLLALMVWGGLHVADGGTISQGRAWRAVGTFAAAIPITFLVTTISLYLGSFLYHIPLWGLGARGGFQGTLRVLGYSMATVPWLLVPYAGLVIQPLMQTILFYHGFRNVHEMGRFKSFVAALLPLAVGLGLAALAICGGCCQPPPLQPGDGTF